MPADVRLNHERELASCRWELEEAEGNKRKKDLIGKYHMVRFFDKQKATRKLKQAKRALKLVEEGGAEKDARKAAQVEVHKCEVDINYAQFYPLDTAYSALYPTKGQKSKKETEDEEEGSGSQGEGDKEARQGDDAMWKVVEKLMEMGSKGKLDKLRNGVLLKTAAGPKHDDDIAAREKKQDRKSDKKKVFKNEKAKAQEQQPAAQDAGDESDGGFFE